MTTPVKHSIAKLLKEKGFDEECNSYYSQALFEGTNPDWEGVFPKYSIFKRSDYHYNSKPNFNDLWFECSAPTIAEVVMWLYEKHGIWIISSYELNIENHKKEWFWIAIKDGEEIAYQYRDFNLPTEAYEAAIEYTLENLI